MLLEAVMVGVLYGVLLVVLSTLVKYTSIEGWRRLRSGRHLSRAWQWVTTFRCPRCAERKSYKVREEWWGHVMCSPCLVEYKRQLVREEKQRLLDEAIEIERRRIAARDYVQAEREKKGYRG